MNEDDCFDVYLRRCDVCGDWFQVRSIGPDRDKLPNHDHAHVKMGAKRHQVDPGGLRARISALGRKLRLDNI